MTPPGARLHAVPTLPPPVQSYLHALTTAVHDTLGEDLLGVYLFGSAAQGAYETGPSDLDVQAVTRLAPPRPVCEALAARLAHGALPCPARGLEFVLYPHAAVRPMTARPAFDLNLNTGAGRPDHVTFDISQESPHWFVLDIAQGRELGRALLGPPPREVFGEVPRPLVLGALAVSHAWHAEHDRLAPNRVLNAARAWRYLATGEWGSKAAGVRWAGTQETPFGVIGRAWRARHTGEALDAAEVETLMTFLHERLEDARASGT